MKETNVQKRHSDNNEYSKIFAAIEKGGDQEVSQELEKNVNRMDEVFKQLFVMKNKNGKLLINSIIENNQLTALNILLKNTKIKTINDTKDSNKNNILHLAAESGSVSIVRELLKYNLDLTIKNNANKTALDLVNLNMEKKPEDSNYKQSAALLRTNALWASEIKTFRLNSIVDSITKSYHDLIESADCYDKVLLVGPSGSGKSTLLNYLMNVKYEIVKKAKGTGDYAKHLDGVEIAKVGHYKNSMTLYPKVIHKEGLNFVYCDLAGLFDNRGDEERIIASSTLQILSTLPGKVKAILVIVDYMDVKDVRKKRLGETIEALTKMLKSDENLIKNVYFIITKADNNNCSNDQILDDIKSLTDENDSNQNYHSNNLILNKLTSNNIIIPKISDNGKSRLDIENILKALESVDSSYFDFTSHDNAQECFKHSLQKIASTYNGWKNELDKTIPDSLKSIDNSIRMQNNTIDKIKERIEKNEQKLKNLGNFSGDDKDDQSEFDENFVMIKKFEDEIKELKEEHSKLIGQNQAFEDCNDLIQVDTVKPNLQHKPKYHYISHISPYPLNRIESRWRGSNANCEQKKPQMTGDGHTEADGKYVGYFKNDDDAKTGKYEEECTADNYIEEFEAKFFTLCKNKNANEIKKNSDKIEKLELEISIRKTVFDALKNRNKYLETGINSRKFQSQVTSALNKKEIIENIRKDKEYREELIKLKEKLDRDRTALKTKKDMLDWDIKVNNNLFNIVKEISDILNLDKDTVISSFIKNMVTIHPGGKIYLETLDQDLASLHKDSSSNSKNLNYKNELGMDLIHLSAWYGSIKDVKLCIKNGSFLQDLTTDGRTLLHIAAVNGHLSLTRWLIDNDIDLNAADKSGNTALHIAAEFGQLKLVKFLVRSGINLLSTNSQMKTAVEIAKEKGHNKIISWLNTQEAFLACQYGNLDLLEKLLNSGVSYQTKNHNGLSLLLIAVLFNNRDIVEFILEKSKGLIIDRDSHNNTALHIAVSKGNKDILELLYKKYPSSMLDKNNQGQSVLHVALLKNNTDIIKFVIEKMKEQDPTHSILISKAKIEINSNQYEVTPIQLTVMLGQIDIFSILSSVENIRNSLKNFHCDLGSLLHIAVRFNQIDILEKLLTNSIDYFGKQSNEHVECQDKDGFTPLHLAAKLGYDNIIDVLYNKYQAKLDTYNKSKETPLHSAIRYQHINVIEKLYCFLGIDSFDKVIPNTNKSARELVEELKNGDDPSIQSDSYKDVYDFIISLEKDPQRTHPKFYESFYQNLVFQGGGVKGIAYLGALKEFEASGHSLAKIKRVAGTSAGSIVALLLALDVSFVEMEKLLSYPMDKFLEDKLPDTSSYWGKAQLAGHMIYSYLMKNTKGFSSGKKLLEWIEEIITKKLHELKIELESESKSTKYDAKYLTFGDLRKLIETGKYNFKHLYVVSTLISDNTDIYGFDSKQVFSSEDPRYDSIVIADAIRCSISIPFVFSPHPLNERSASLNQKYPTKQLYVDGGMTHNYPIDIFDCMNQAFNTSHDCGINTRTLGFSLIPSDESTRRDKHKNANSAFNENEKGDINLLDKLFSIIAYNELVRFNKAHEMRTVFIDDMGVRATDFNLSNETKNKLIESGKKGMRQFCDRYTNFCLSNVNENNINQASKVNNESKLKNEILVDNHIDSNHEDLYIADHKSSCSQSLSSSSNQLEPFYISTLNYVFNSVKQVSQYINSYNSSNVTANASIYSVQKSNLNLSAECNLQLYDKQPSIPTDQYHFSANCLPGKVNEVNVLYCNGDITVFPKGSSTDAIIIYSGDTSPTKPNTGDHYQLENCKKFEWHGKESIYCEGDGSTTFIYQPKLPSRPLKNFDGQLMLFSVGTYLVSQAYQWLRSPINRTHQVVHYIANKDKLIQLNKLQEKLNNLKEKYTQYINDSSKQLNWVRDGLENFEFFIKKLLKKKNVSSDELNELDADMEYFLNEFKNELLQTEISSKQILPQNSTDHILSSIEPQIAPKLTIMKITGDGHCLYRAVSYYLCQGEDVQWLRKIVAAHLEYNLADFGSLIQSLTKNKTIKQYLEDVRNGNEWADHIEIEVLMRVLNRPIVIIESNGQIRNIQEIERTGEPIFVYYNGHNHYDALILDETKGAKQILEMFLNGSKRVGYNKSVINGLQNHGLFTIKTTNTVSFITQLVSAVDVQMNIAP